MKWWFITITGIVAVSIIFGFAVYLTNNEKAQATEKKVEKQANKRRFR